MRRESGENTCWQGCGDTGNLYIAGRSIIWYTTLGSDLKLSKSLGTWPTVLLLGVHLKWMKRSVPFHSWDLYSIHSLKDILGWPWHYLGTTQISTNNRADKYLNLPKQNLRSSEHAQVLSDFSHTTFENIHPKFSRDGWGRLRRAQGKFWTGYVLQ